MSRHEGTEPGIAVAAMPSAPIWRAGDAQLADAAVPVEESVNAADRSKIVKSLYNRDAGFRCRIVSGHSNLRKQIVAMHDIGAKLSDMLGQPSLGLSTVSQV